ncbi:MAG TPA: PIN domain-containing protein [Terriglobales bacterium]|nr:PIN domain-containing protein [Terriglobales bacterium]
MAIIIDADVIIGGEKGTLDLRRWLASRPDDEFEIAAITVAALWHGVERARGSHRLRRQQYLERLIAALPVIPYTQRTAYEHARIWAEVDARGKMIGYYDLIVAATALERGSQVATFNKRHVAQIAGLTVLEPH